MSRRRSTCFFKILLDPTAPHLPLPPDFVTNHLENKIPKYPILRSASGGYSWRLKIKKIGESYCFSDGWDNVVRDIHLGFGDFLVFRFDYKSSFKMVVFSPNGCEKDIPPKTQVDNVNVNININDNVNINVDDNCGIVDDDNDDDVVKDDVDDDEDEIDDDVVFKDDVDDDEDEIDDDDDEDDEDEEGYEEKDDGDEDEDDGDDDGDGDGGGGGGDIDGDDGDPFFITKTHKNMMRLPPEFAELAGIDGERTLTVANVDGKEWEISVRVEKLQQSERYHLSAGWYEFRRSNEISDGDECVFKFIRSEDKLLLARVTKSKRPARQPAGENPASGVVKRRREEPERNSGRIPVRKVETRAARVDGGGGVKEVKRARGRPAKRIGGNPTRRK